MVQFEIMKSWQFETTHHVVTAEPAIDAVSSAPSATVGHYRCERCTLGFRVAPRPDAGSGFREVEALRCGRCGCRFWSAVPDTERPPGGETPPVVVGVWPSPSEGVTARRDPQGRGR